MLTVPRQLSRILTRGRRFIPEVDGLRFIAITAVVLFHLSGHTLAKHMSEATIRPAEAWLPSVFYIGHYGVQLFFVLSGFLLATPFAKWRLGLGAKPSLRTYYFRRLTRLEPPYIVLMSLIFVCGVILPGASMGLNQWPNLLASLLYQHNLLYGFSSPINVVAWSLEIEVQFYCLAPFLAAVFSISSIIARRVFLLAIVVALPLLRSFIPPAIGARFNSLPWHLEFFLAGFLLADVFLLSWKEAPIRSFAWDISSLIAWPALIALMMWKRLAVLIAPVIILAYLGAFKGKASSWVLSRPLITTLGGMCYSMYLVHYALILMSGRISNRLLLGSNFTTRLALDALLAIPIILGVTAIVFIVLERPCMDPAWFDKVRGIRRGRARPVEPPQEAVQPTAAPPRPLRAVTGADE
jgi:peptidoglycan/LPS O-acetylase OafA/YrhL